MFFGSTSCRILLSQFQQKLFPANQNLSEEIAATIKNDLFVFTKQRKAPPLKVSPRVPIL